MNKVVLSIAVVLCTAGAVLAQDARPPATVRPSTSGNLRDLQIRGRVQAQFGITDADNDEGGGSYSTFEIRRARLGLRGTLFDNVRAQLEANLVPGSAFSMRSAFVEWREHKPAYLKLGYDKPTFGFEENTSSAGILTVERSLINNALVTGPLTGLALNGAMDMLSYSAGMYTDRDNVNADGADKYLYNASVGLKLDELLESANLRFRFDYLASDDDGGKLGGKFDDAMAASVHFASGGFDVRAEYMVGDSDGDAVSGWYVTPSMFVSEKLQVVGRLEQAESDKARGLRAPGRYMQRADGLAVRETTDANGSVISKVDPQRGDSYQAVYLGLNYYLNGNNHKLMTGVELAELDNTDAGKLEAVTVYGAWRMLF